MVTAASSEIDNVRDGAPSWVFLVPVSFAVAVTRSRVETTPDILCGWHHMTSKVCDECGRPPGEEDLMALRRQRDAAATVKDAAALNGAVRKPGTHVAKDVTSNASRNSATRNSSARSSGKEGITPARAKRLISVGKVVAPLLAPYALAAAGVARAQWDDYRARKLGVSPDQLGAYSGRGGALHARISRIAQALPELTDAPGDRPVSDAARAFARETGPRLADLSVAVRAAEQMPATRRRTAFRAVSGELDQIETGLLTQLGLRV